MSDDLPFDLPQDINGLPWRELKKELHRRRAQAYPALDQYRADPDEKAVRLLFSVGALLENAIRRGESYTLTNELALVADVMQAVGYEMLDRIEGRYQ